MDARRFGRKLKLPATVAIKHQILKLMLKDAIEAEAREKTEAVSLQLPETPRAWNAAR